MTSSKLFAPPSPRASVPWLALVSLMIAAAIGNILMSHFIDVLHLSIARGEALRVTQHMVGVLDPAAGQDMHVTQLQLPRSSQ